MRWSICFLLACGACTVTAGRVNHFDATPHAVCAGHASTLAWDVTGRASLAADPKPAGWTDGAVASRGERAVVLETPTQFSLEALDAERAVAGHGAAQQVGILKSGTRGANASCDAAARRVQASLDFSKLPSDARLASIGHPLVQSAGRTSARRICVAQQSERACVDGDGKVPFSGPAQGKLELTAELDASESCEDGSAPTQLRIDVEFDCGAQGAAHGR